MRGINKAIVAGIVGNDIVLRYTKEGEAVTNFSIATHYKNAAKEDKTEWHRVNCFGKRAEIAGEFLKKGSAVFIQGSLKTRKYFDENKIERWVTEISAHELQFLDRKPKNENEEQIEEQAIEEQAQMEEWDTEGVPF